jgi:hypothetical protein
MPPPPAAHAAPDPSGVDGRPEPEASAYLIDLGHTASFDSSSLGQAPGLEEDPSNEVLDDEPPKRAPGKHSRKTGRPSVPAWGDIMFGPGPGR